MRLFLDEKQAQLQRQKMVSGTDLPLDASLLPAIGKSGTKLRHWCRPGEHQDP